MAVTIKNASLKRPIQAMLKLTKQQRDKCISLMKESHWRKGRSTHAIEKGVNSSIHQR